MIQKFFCKLIKCKILPSLFFVFFLELKNSFLCFYFCTMSTHVGKKSTESDSFNPAI